MNINSVVIFPVCYVINDDLTIDFEQEGADEVAAWVASNPGKVSTFVRTDLDQRELTEAESEQRFKLLTATDWYLIRQVETGQSAPAEVLAYRQALRDLEQQKTEAIVWPVLVL